MFVPIELRKEDGRLIYVRGEIRKILPECEIIVNPVEPINLPKNVTRYLEIDFPPVLIKPNAIETIYLKFPIEIGVFAKEGDKITVVDVFTFDKPKYTLYGTPKNGVVCRWFWSEVYYEIPEVDPLKHGVLKLVIKNGGDWVEVGKVVLDCYAMKIYYSEFASCWAEMKILSKISAETTFVDKPIIGGMKKAIELYTTRRLIGRSFTMEWGLK